MLLASTSSFINVSSIQCFIHEKMSNSCSSYCAKLFCSFVFEIIIFFFSFSTFKKKKSAKNQWFWNQPFVMSHAAHVLPAWFWFHPCLVFFLSHCKPESFFFFNVRLFFLSNECLNEYGTVREGLLKSIFIQMKKNIYILVTVWFDFWHCVFATPAPSILTCII